MQASISLGRIAGIPIGLHYSWLIMATLITLSLSAHFSATHPDWSRSLVWFSAVVTALLFFATLVAHELSHGSLPDRAGFLFAPSRCSHSAINVILAVFNLIRDRRVLTLHSEGPMARSQKIEDLCPVLSEVRGRPVRAHLRPPTTAPYVERRNLTSRDTLVGRVLGAFLEMPGLTLSIVQATRLFSLSPGICARILAELIVDHKLRLTVDGRYAMAHRT